jgi:dihydroxy-acid dehydratase
VFDVEARRLDVELSEDAIRERLARWQAPEPNYKSGVFAKYASLVSSASEGAVTLPANNALVKHKGIPVEDDVS